MRVCASNRVSLPDDVLLHVCTFLEVHSVLSFRLTCKQVEKVTRIRWLWQDTVYRHFLARNKALPKPIADLRLAPARDLECAAVRGTRLEATWTGRAPGPRQHLRFDASELAKKAGVELGPYHAYIKGEQAETGASRVICLPGKGGELFVTVLDGRHVVVWRATRGATEPVVLSHWSAPEHYGRVEVVANQDLESKASVAVTCALDVGTKHWIPHSTAYIFHIDPFEGSIHLLASLPHNTAQVSMATRRVLWSFRGDFILLDTPLRLWNWRLGLHEQITRPETGPIDPSHLITAQRLGDRYLVMVEEQTLIFAPLTPLDPATRTPLPDHTPSPGAIYPLPFAASRSASLVIPPEWHEYLSIPRARDDPDKPLERPRRPMSLVMCEHLLGSHDMPFHAFLSRLDFAPTFSQEETKPREIPLITGWRFMQGTERAVLPSAGMPRVGPSGRGVFLETRRAHGAEDDRHMAPPVVRAVVGLWAPPASFSYVVSPSSGQDDAHVPVDGGTMHGCTLCGESITGPLSLDVHEGELYARRCATGELARRQYRLSAMDFEDAAGRLIVGNSDGWVEVMDFA